MATEELIDLSHDSSKGFVEALDLHELVNRGVVDLVAEAANEGADFMLIFGCFLAG